MFRRHPEFNVADNIFFWRGVCEMYEQSYCLLFYDKCNFCLMVFAPPPKRDTLIVSMTSSICLALRSLLLLRDRPKFLTAYFVEIMYLSN